MEDVSLLASYCHGRLSLQKAAAQLFSWVTRNAEQQQQLTQEATTLKLMGLAVKVGACQQGDRAGGVLFCWICKVLLRVFCLFMFVDHRVELCQRRHDSAAAAGWLALHTHPVVSGFSVACMHTRTL
jgi:hypothetical protein